jgi:hypothetical protein
MGLPFNAARGRAKDGSRAFLGGDFPALCQCSPKADGFPKKPELGFLMSTVRCPEALLQGRVFD